VTRIRADIGVDLLKWADEMGIDYDAEGELVGMFITSELDRNRFIPGVRFINSKEIPASEHQTGAECTACRMTGEWNRHHCYGCGVPNEVIATDGPTKDCICDPEGAEYQ
jgi:hypothetical protein